MNMSRVISQLIKHEGMVLHGYTDSLGYLTIGVGRLIDKRRGGGISKDEALYLLTNDISRCVVELDENLPWWRNLDDVRQSVLVNMCFNLGIRHLLTFRNTLRFIEQRDFAKAAKHMLKSKWARQVKARADDLAEMMKTGKDSWGA